MEDHTVANVSQRGKQITIYAFYQPEKDWEPILTRITEELTNAGVRPSYRPVDDRAVPGSNYLSYRNDSGARGEGYNPDNYNDPFQHYAVQNIYNQPQIPIWGERERVQNDRNRGCCQFT